MAGALSLDDQLLGEKTHNYCSSSEDESEPDDELSEYKVKKTIPDHYDGHCTNTGPKGVLNDWRRYKQLETEKREEQELERLQLMKKLSMTCRSELDDQKEATKDEELMEQLEREFDSMDSEFLTLYRQQRVEEMRSKLNNVPKFGKVVNLVDRTGFLEALDKENPNVTVIMHVYESRFAACESMNKCLHCLASQYPTVKFCKIKASQATLSYSFSESGVPALLVYKHGDLIGNFVGLSKELGEDFFASDVESFLQEHGFLPLNEMTETETTGIRSSNKIDTNSDSDSDFGVD